MGLAQSIQQHLNAQAVVSSWPVMPFGKHKGTPIDQIETSYLQWCLQNADILAKKQFLKSEIERLLRMRNGVAPPLPPLPTADEPLNNTEGEIRLLETIGQLRADLHRERLDAAAMQREIRELEYKLRNDKREDLRKENRDLQDEVAAMRRARAAGAGSDAKSWWAANRKRIMRLSHPDAGGSHELMCLFGELDAKIK